MPICRCRRALVFFTWLLCTVLLVPAVTQAERGDQPSFMAPTPARLSPLVPPYDTDHLLAQQPVSGLRSFPTRFDWREAGIVTTVKDQGACGACYAFATLGDLEALLARDGDGQHDFSENHVKECVWDERFGAGASCDGGSFSMAADLLAQTGTTLESCNPYQPYDASCVTGCDYGYTVLDWREIAGSTPPSPDVLKYYLQSYGPLFVTIYAGNSDPWETVFQAYDGSYSLYYGGTQTPNHAVLLVGWDDSLTHAGGSGAWIVKNSWGTDWGGTCGYGSEKGYFTIAYGSASIGAWASAITAWQPYDAAGQLYLHDEAGWQGAVGFSSLTAWALARYSASDETQLERVEFVTTDVNAQVDVYVYDTFHPMTKSLGNLLYQDTGLTFTEAGYHSVALTSPLAWPAGSERVAVIKVRNTSYTYVLGAEGESSTAPGETYISSNGVDGTWTDMGIAHSAAICLRLRASSAGPTSTETATPTPTGTVTPTRTRTSTPTPTGTAENTPTATATETDFAVGTATPSPTLTARPSWTPLPSLTPTETSLVSPTLTRRPSWTPLPSLTPTQTRRPSPTLTRNPWPTMLARVRLPLVLKTRPHRP